MDEATPSSGHTLLYHRNHNRVRKVRGSASRQICEHCGGRAREWATRVGLDSELQEIDPETGFLPLCSRCHHRYDQNLPDWTGKHHTAETREKLRQIKTGVSNHTPDSRRKISEAMQGREFSDETRERMRQAQIGKTMSLEARDRMSAAQRIRYGLEPGERASHGNTGYRKGCRCDECRAGHAGSERERKARRAMEAGQPLTG